MHSLFGPIEGCRHDVTLLRHSKLLDFFYEYSNIFNGYYIYGDPAYAVSNWMVSGYKGTNLSYAQRFLNTEMSRLRTSVEWNFGYLKMLWPFITFKPQQKIMHSSVGKLVLVSMLLTNCRCCLRRGNQISKYFKLAPPTLQEYLSDINE